MESPAGVEPASPGLRPGTSPLGHGDALRLLAGGQSRDSMGWKYPHRSGADGPHQSRQCDIQRRRQRQRRKSELLAAVCMMRVVYDAERVRARTTVHSRVRQSSSLSPTEELRCQSDTDGGRTQGGRKGSCPCLPQGDRDRTAAPPTRSAPVARGVGDGPLAQERVAAQGDAVAVDPPGTADCDDGAAGTAVSADGGDGRGLFSRGRTGRISVSHDGPPGVGCGQARGGVRTIAAGRFLLHFCSTCCLETAPSDPASRR